MALSLATVGAKISATFLNLIIGRVNRQGLTAVIPTTVSVSGSGSSFILGATGVVNFTSSTVISLNGCFTSEFDAYRIVVSVATISSISNINVRLRASGTDLTPAAYSNAVTEETSTTGPTRQSASGATSSNMGRVATQGTFATADLAAPALARFKSSFFSSYDADGVSRVGGWGFNASNIADGITIFFDGAYTGTGSLSVYGYNKGV